MTRTPLALIAVAAFIAAGCELSPNSPSSSPAASTSLLGAKPPSGPTATNHTLSFGNGLAGGGTVSGWITGSAADGHLLAHAASTSAFTLTIFAAAEGGPAQDNACLDGTIEGLGLIGHPISGGLTIDVDQDGERSYTDPVMDWELSGVSDNNGATWRLSGISTFNYPPVVSGDENSMSVTNNFIKVIFSGPPSSTSGRKGGSSVSYTCRVNLAMTMSK